MTSVGDTNRRIARNTLFLYIRMLVMMGVALYTSRVTLQLLGVENFGIYDVVAGIVVLFSFIQSALGNATQRFLSYALGHGGSGEAGRVFGMSRTLHLLMAAVVVLLAETLGLWLLHRMNFPDARREAVTWTYQFSLLTCCVQLVRIPYHSYIIAQERMSFYAWTSIIEAVLKLGAALVLKFYAGDKLICYAFLLLAVTAGMNLVYRLYCRRQFADTRQSCLWAGRFFREFLTFSGWSVTGSLATVSVTQGLNMIINLFCGVAVNAAVGIANQVMVAITQFLGNFQLAFNPQLVKSEAAGEHAYVMDLVFKTSRLSYYLMLLIALPVFVNCEFLLTAWLGTVPPYAVAFSQLIILYILSDALSTPLWLAIQATGKIWRYQVYSSVLLVVNLPVAWLLLKYGYSPLWIFVFRAALNVVMAALRLYCLRSLIAFRVADYLREVVLKVVIVSLVVVPLPLWMHGQLEEGWLFFLLSLALCEVLAVAGIYLLGLTSGEKTFICTSLKTKLYALFKKN